MPKNWDPHMQIFASIVLIAMPQTNPIIVKTKHWMEVIINIWKRAEGVLPEIPVLVKNHDDEDLVVPKNSFFHTLKSNVFLIMHWIFITLLTYLFSRTFFANLKWYCYVYALYQYNNLWLIFTIKVFKSKSIRYY